MHGAPELLWKPQAAAESPAELPSSFDLKGQKGREGKDAPIGKIALNCSEANSEAVWFTRTGRQSLAQNEPRSVDLIFQTIKNH